MVVYMEPLGNRVCRVVPGWIVTYLSYLTIICAVCLGNEFEPDRKDWFRFLICGEGRSWSCCIILFLCFSFMSDVIFRDANERLSSCCFYHEHLVGRVKSMKS